MNKFIPAGPFTYRRSSDGCDETFDVIAVPTGEFVTAFHFWEAEEECEARARWLAAALNLSDAVTNLVAVHESNQAKRSSIPEPVPTSTNLALRQDRSERVARVLDGKTKFEQILSVTRLLADAKHWCKQECVDFDDCLLHASRKFCGESGNS